MEILVTKIQIEWEGNTNNIISGWPEDVRKKIGGLLFELEKGNFEILTNTDNSKKVNTVDDTRVWELKDKEGGVFHRLVYLYKINEIMYILHCFIKKTNTIPKKEINVINARIKNLKKRLEKK